jgi:long-chain fatty acid transport protein
MTSLRLGLCLALVLLAPRTAGAHAFEEVFGTDARFKAMAGAATALADGPAAAYFNPARLTQRPGMQVSLGFDLATSHLYSDPIPVQEVTNQTLSMICFGLTGEVWPERAFVGVLLALPLGPLMVMDSSSLDSAPTFPLYGDRLQVLSLLVALGVRVLDSLSLGLGASVLAGSQLNMALGVPALSDREAEMNFTYKMSPVAALVAGVSWKPWRTLQLGLTYRMALFHKLQGTLDTALDLVGVQADILVGFEGVMWYTPQQLAFGASYRFWDRLDLSADLTWYEWSRYPGPYVQLSVLNSATAALLKVPAPYEGEYSDIVVPRIGVAYQIGSRVVARAGYAFRPTPAPLPQGTANAVDSSKHVLATGGGVEILRGPRWPLNLRVDLSFALHLLNEANRGAALKWGGKLFNVGATVTAGL